ncbi:MAG: hypothetical protein EPN94_11545 [Nitrospirae bacterium]|nr:MAG: hypothetical protein EPN94_11545 [Nitrospirota bacterium]
MKIKHLKNEEGIALVMVILLSAISLAIMAGLVYMIMSQTEISGIQKRYKTAQEAGLGGTAVAYQFIAVRGAPLTGLPALWQYTAITPQACAGTSGGTSYTGILAKIMTGNWMSDGDCNRSIAIDTGDNTTYDMSFELGTGTTYKVYAKIVDTVEGNSGGDEGLLKSGVVASNSGEVTVQSRPFLYTIEMVAESRDNPEERAKLSILYQY